LFRFGCRFSEKSRCLIARYGAKLQKVSAMTLIGLFKRMLRAMPSFKLFSGPRSAPKQLDEIVAEVERLTAERQEAERARAIRVSSDRLSVTGNLGSYTSKSDGEFAIRLLQRLASKAR